MRRRTMTYFVAKPNVVDAERALAAACPKRPMHRLVDLTHPLRLLRVFQDGGYLLTDIRGYVAVFEPQEVEEIALT
jgi:hypothetical protein